jgi:outer membrane protein OmpA-like peptidoglycan-associated protein
LFEFLGRPQIGFDWVRTHQKLASNWLWESGDFQTAVAPSSITVTLQPEARRLDDIVFARNNDRVNDCGKRLLLDELTPMLRSDPEARVILIGHRDGDERKAGMDEARVRRCAVRPRM